MLAAGLVVLDPANAAWTLRARVTQAPPGSDTAHSGVLVVDSGPRFQTPGWPRGMWHVTASGDVTKLVGRRWRVHAWSPLSGAVVAPRRASSRAPFAYAVLHDGKTTPLRAAPGRLACPSWSVDGELLAYLIGAPSQYGPSASAITGKLWVADADSLVHPVAVARGLFPECPSWSPTESSLAYLIRGETERTWEMRRLTGLATEVVRRFRIEVPSVSGPSTNRTFDFSNAGDLFFLARRSIYVDSAEGTTRFGPAGVLDELREGASGWLRYVRSLRVSPDGRIVAATGSWYRTGVVDHDELVTVVPNRFRAWSGNFGVVTFGLDPDGFPSTQLFPADPGSPIVELPPSAHKKSIHADLDGNWFMYGSARGKLRWYAPDGSVIRVVELGFAGGAVASTAGGAVDVAINH